ncbi:hypothetical protein [Caballeronia sp. 15711]|uniref:hypothetical protein n=1 Tax=Caballeronia sp. 15711 TaxID=3391029 RepID=UPI0039E2A374
MNREKLDKVLKHLLVQAAYPTRIDATVAPFFDPRVTLETFTRVNWSASEISVAEVQFQSAEGERKMHMLKFLAKTRTRVVRIGDDGIPPDTQDLNADDVVLDLYADFAIEYVISGCEPTELDDEGMAEFTAHNMPYHLWPYFRELAQSTALRLRVPIPTIPAFRVPKSHQAVKK